MGNLIRGLIRVAGTYQGSRHRPRKKSFSCVCVIFIHTFLKLYISQTKSCFISCFLLLIFLLRDFFSSQFNSRSSRTSSTLKEFSLEYLLVGFSFNRKKRKLSWNDNSLSFIVTRCHSLSLIIRCDFLYQSLSPLYHSMSFVVTHCHSLPLDVSLVCLLINDQFSEMK